MSVLEDIREDLDRGAGRLVAEYHKRLMRDARAMCGNDAEAEDLVFRTFEQAIRKIDSFRGESSLYAWMKSIMENFCRSSRRRKSATESVLGDMDEALPESAENPSSLDRLVAGSDAEVVREAIASLPADQKEAVVLHYFMELPIAKMARFLAIPEGTVKFRLHVARKTLGVVLSKKLKKPLVVGVLAGLSVLSAVCAAWVGGVFSPDVRTKAVAVSGPDECEPESVLPGGTETGFQKKEDSMNTDKTDVSVSTTRVEAEMTAESTAEAAVSLVKTRRNVLKRCGRAIVGLLTYAGVASVSGEVLFYSPVSASPALSWDEVGAWKTDLGSQLVNRLPDGDDILALNALGISLAGEGVTEPHALRVTNNVQAVVKAVRLGTKGAENDASYTKSGRVIGLTIEEGGFLGTTQDDPAAFAIGFSAAGAGVLTMTGGITSNLYLTVGHSGIGGMTNVGGTVCVAEKGRLLMGYQAGSYGELTMTNGMIRYEGKDWDTTPVVVGSGGEGRFNLSGGVVSNKTIIGSKSVGTLVMSGGTIVNRVYVGAYNSGRGNVDFTGGEIKGHLIIGHNGYARVTFDGGRHVVPRFLSTVLPDCADPSLGEIGLYVGRYAGSFGELIIRKPGLTFENPQASAVVGYDGIGRVDSYTNTVCPYLKLGGNRDGMSRWTIHENVSAEVSCVAQIGGYPMPDGTKRSGFGEVILSNATLKLTQTGSTDPQLRLGMYENGYGVLRGNGYVQGSTRTANTVRMSLGRGRIIGDGFGEQKTLDLNYVISCTNSFVNADDEANGWYAVNKGGVLFPRVWLSSTSATRVIGSLPAGGVADFVNSVLFSVSGVPEVSGGYTVRGGVYADDRDDLHLDALPQHVGIVGLWKLGVFTAVSGTGTKSFENIDLTFRYDHAKTRDGDCLVLRRWNGSSWVRVATDVADGNPRISCTGLSPVSGQTFNVGIFALVKTAPGMSVVIR